MKLQLQAKDLYKLLNDKNLDERDKTGELRLLLRVRAFEAEPDRDVSDGAMDLAVRDEIARFKRNRAIWQVSFGERNGV